MRAPAAGGAGLRGTFFGGQGVGAGARDFFPGLRRPGARVGPPAVGRPPRSGSGGYQDHRDGGENRAFGAAAHGINGGWSLQWQCEVGNRAKSWACGRCTARQRVRCRVTPTSISPNTVMPLAPCCERAASPADEAAGTLLHPASTPAVATAANASRTVRQTGDAAGAQHRFITRRPGDCPECLPARTCPRCPCRTRRAACHRRRWCACPWGPAGCGP